MEWSEMLGVCQQTAKNRLQILHKAGRLKSAKARRIGIDNVARSVPVYEFIPAKK